MEPPQSRYQHPGDVAEEGQASCSGHPEAHSVRAETASPQPGLLPGQGKEGCGVKLCTLSSGPFHGQDPGEERIVHQG